MMITAQDNSVHYKSAFSGSQLCQWVNGILPITYGDFTFTHCDLFYSTLPLNFDSSTGAGFGARNIFFACFANLEFSKPADGKMN
jgi:hypothetical protein